MINHCFQNRKIVKLSLLNEINVNNNSDNNYLCEVKEFYFTQNIEF